MKTRHCAALLIALLTGSLLAGCYTATVEHAPEKTEKTVEHRLEAAADPQSVAVPEEPVPMAAVSLETEPVRQISEPAAPIIPETTVPVVPETTPPEKPGTAEKLTVEQAKAIALEHAGFGAEEVRFLRAEYEIDDRIAQYDIEFDVDRWEYEYEIHAETGRILSFDKDD